MKQRKTNKKTVFWFMAFLALILIGTGRTVKAERERVIELVYFDEAILKGDCYYKERNNRIDEVEIVGIRQGKKNPYIPDKIDGKKVTMINLGCMEWEWYEGERDEDYINTLKIPRYVDTCQISVTPIIKRYQVHAKNEYYSIKAGCLYSKDKKTLVAYPTGSKRKHFTIPKGTVEIGYKAFISSDLETVSMPDSVTYIADGAFEFSTNLKNIRLSSKLESIEAYAFGYTGLRKIVLPKTLNYVGDYAFEDCNRLKEVTIKGNTKIDNYVFCRCKSLKKVKLSDIAESVSIGEGAFQECRKLKKIVVLSNAKEGYISKEAFVEKGKRKNLTILAKKNSYAYSYAKKYKRRGFKVKKIVSSDI